MSIRTDEKTKEDVAKFASSVGLSVSAFVTVLLKQAMLEGRVVLSPALEPTPYLERTMTQAKADYKSGKGVTTINNTAELDAVFDAL